MKGISQWTKSTLKKMEKAMTSRVPIQTYRFGNQLKKCSGDQDRWFVYDPVSRSNSFGYVNGNVLT